MPANQINNTSKRLPSPGQRPQPHKSPAFQPNLRASTDPMKCYPFSRSETSQFQWHLGPSKALVCSPDQNHTLDGPWHFNLCDYKQNNPLELMPTSQARSHTSLTLNISHGMSASEVRDCTPTRWTGTNAVTPLINQYWVFSWLNLKHLPSWSKTRQAEVTHTK